MPIDFYSPIPLKHFAKKLGMTPGAVRTKKSRGALPDWIFVKIGNALFVDIDRFNHWINDQEKQKERAAARVRRKSAG